MEPEHYKEHKRQPDFAITPHGWTHRSTILRPGESVDAATLARYRPKTTQQIRALNPHGWIESATYCPAVPLGYMEFSVTVPDPPEYAGALIYLFAGAQDMHLSTVLQPVLQWGSNGCFGGEFWTVACWQADSSGAHHVSPFMRVDAGDVISCKLQVTSHTDSAADWRIEARDNRTSDCVFLDVNGLELLMLFLVGGALEAYSLDCCGEPCLTMIGIPPKCEQYPQNGSTTFDGIHMKDLRGNPIYALWDNRQYEGSGPNCGFEVTSVSNQVTLKY